MSPRKAAQPNNRGVPRGKAIRTPKPSPTTASPESAKADTETGGETPPRRVAIYARVSSNTQATKGTIDSQLEALRSHVAGIGAEVVATYIDDGYSGADRPGLDELRGGVDQGAAGGAGHLVERIQQMAQLA